MSKKQLREFADWLAGMADEYIAIAERIKGLDEPRLGERLKQAAISVDRLSSNSIGLDIRTYPLDGELFELRGKHLRYFAGLVREKAEGGEE